MQLVEQVPDAWSRTIGVRRSNGDVETISAGFVVEMQADHLEHHVNQILAIRREGGGSFEKAPDDAYWSGTLHL